MISIVIVNYNCGDLLDQCVSSLRSSVELPYEIVVVDNNSTDGSLAKIQEGQNIKIIREQKNWGFAKACNIGARAARGTVLHFLNPDTIVRSDIVETYKLVLADRGPSIFATKITDSNGAEQKTGHALPTLRNMVLSLVAPSKVQRWYLGASVVVRAETFWKLGGFSEDYFMYAEDVDLFYRAHLAGLHVLQTDSKVLHHKEGSSKNVWSSQERLERIEKSAAIFTRKFNIQIDYFVFKHIAFLRGILVNPPAAVAGIRAYWRQLAFRAFGRK